MSNDTPPRACLADFGFTTMLLDPMMSCSTQLEGGTIMFMSPELLKPSMFGFKDSVPTPEADIYAFGLVIYQVCDQDRSYLSFTHMVQVLMGEIPWRGLRIAELEFKMVSGVRPAKPENASAIGFSDSLWDFVERCWDGNMELRPKIREVVAELGRATVNWDGVMPPRVQAENVASVSKEPMSGSMQYCEFAIPILPRYCSLNNGTGAIFGRPSSIVPEGPTELQIISAPFNLPNTLSTNFTELPPEMPQGVVIRPFRESHPAPRVPTPRRKEPCDDVPAVYPHLNQHYQPPPTWIPQKKRTGFRYLRWKFHEIFRSPSPSNKGPASGKTPNGAVPNSPPRNYQFVTDNYRVGKDGSGQHPGGDASGIFQSPSEPVPSPNLPPLNLAKTTAESRRPPDQSPVGGVSGVASPAPYTSLHQTNANPRCRTMLCVIEISTSYPTFRPGSLLRNQCQIQ